MTLPFALDPGGWLEPEPRAVFEEGVVFGAEKGVLAVAWLDEPAGVTLEAVVEEDLARLLRDDLLLDREPVRIGGLDAVRTFSLHIAAVPTASEQWRLLAGGRRWTLAATTALADQPLWGPRLAAVAATFRLR